MEETQPDENNNDDEVIMNTEEIPEAPSPMNSIVYFLTLTIIYLSAFIFTIMSATDEESIETSSNNNIFTLIYVILIVSGSYFLNINISKALCPNNNIQYYNIVFVTFIPWLIVFGLIYLLLGIFPGWIKPFSNTIGYQFVALLGLENKVKELLAQQERDGDANTTDFKIAIENINNHTHLFINEINSDFPNFNKFKKQLESSGILKVNNDNNDTEFIEIFKLLKIKDLIGKIIWYILAGTLIVSISYNYIINMSCETTLEETNKIISNLYNS